MVHVRGPDEYGLAGEAVLTVLGAGLTLGLIFCIALTGKYLEIGFLQSPGGILVATVFMIEFLFITSLAFLALTGRI